MRILWLSCKIPELREDIKSYTTLENMYDSQCFNTSVSLQISLHNQILPDSSKTVKDKVIEQKKWSFLLIQNPITKDCNQ